MAETTIVVDMSDMVYFLHYRHGVPIDIAREYLESILFSYDAWLSDSSLQQYSLVEFLEESVSSVFRSIDNLTPMALLDILDQALNIYDLSDLWNQGSYSYGEEKVFYGLKWYDNEIHLYFGAPKS